MVNLRLFTFHSSYDMHGAAHFMIFQILPLQGVSKKHIYI